jgi:RNA binding exosome subunit
LWRVLSQISVAYIDVRFFAHATENIEKVVAAVQHVLPSNYTEDITFKKSNLQGHYGNPITLFEAKIRDEGAISALVENLSFCLGESDKKTLSKQVHLHMERGSLYIRLNKQAAFQGKLELCKSDPIRIRLRFKKAKVEEIIKACQELGLLK